MAQRRSSQEMLSLVAYYEESGLTRREAAAEAGIAVQTLDYWRRKATRRSAGEFIEIHPPSSFAPTTEVEYPNGVSVKFFGVVDPRLLLALVSSGRRAA